MEKMVIDNIIERRTVLIYVRTQETFFSVDTNPLVNIFQHFVSFL